jgi:hypothetical protein
MEQLTSNIPSLACQDIAFMYYSMVFNIAKLSAKVQEICPSAWNFSRHKHAASSTIAI